MNLTAREREVLSLAAEGLSNDGIAWRMKIARKTVDQHFRNMHQKNDTKSSSRRLLYLYGLDALYRRLTPDQRRAL